MKEYLAGAMRGRNPTNPTSRKTGIPLEQRIEIGHCGITFCLTTVWKDNVVIEIEEDSNIKGEEECQKDSQG